MQLPNHIEKKNCRPLLFQYVIHIMFYNISYYFHRNGALLPQNGKFTPPRLTNWGISPLTALSFDAIKEIVLIFLLLLHVLAIKSSKRSLAPHLRPFWPSHIEGLAESPLRSAYRFKGPNERGTRTCETPI